MPVDRGLYRVRFGRFPAWKCPTCQKGILNLDKESLADLETGPSRRAHSHEAWDPDWVVRRFSAHLVCSNQSCGERVVIFGDASEEEHDYVDCEGEWQRDFERIFEPKGLHPAPLPFELSDNLPEEIVECLVASGSLIWQSPDAAANKVRQAIEALMDIKRVKKTSVSNNKRKRLPLHNRIKEFEKKDRDNAEILLALKWLGNSGSHREALTRSDVLDAYDMMEHVLNDLFDNSSVRIKSMAQAINKRKGPLKKGP